MASRGATNHSTTTLTHQPHSTRVYYHTTTFQPNTVNGGGGQQRLHGTGRVKGRERGAEKEEVIIERKKNSLVYAHACDRCLHDDTIDNHDKTFPLSSKPRFHREILQDKTNKGVGGGKRDIPEGGVLNTNTEVPRC